jgi:hypothetical protein
MSSGDALDFVLDINIFSGLGWSFFTFAVSFIESLNSARGIDQLLLSGKERMACGA